jgi:hypothetical protein
MKSAAAVAASTTMAHIFHKDALQWSDWLAETAGKPHKSLM